VSVLLRHLARLFNTTSTPGALASGDLWYRSDTDQVHASDGAAGEPLIIGPQSNLPIIRSTAWHNIPIYGDNGTANVPVNRIFAIPFWPGRTATLTALAANVTLALAGGNLRMGLYASDGVLPTTLVADYGTVTAGVTGVRSITGLSTSVRPVLHYLVVGRQGGILNLGLTTRNTVDPIISEATTPTFGAAINAYYIDGVSGALPGTFGTPAGVDTGPALSVQLT